MKDAEPGGVPEPGRSVLAAVAAGGVLGAESRYGVDLLLPHSAGSWPWATLVINVAGSALLGVLMAWLATMPRPHRLLRPLLGVGVLGGFTTFSTFALDTHQLLLASRPGPALGYVAASLVGGLGAAGFADAATRRLLGHRSARRRSP